MPDFTVDIDGLHALGTNLDRTADNLDEATRKLDALGPDSIGPDDLDEATADFRFDWEEGLDKIREAVGEVKDGLEAAKQMYAKIDQGLNDAFTQMESDVAKNIRTGG